MKSNFKNAKKTSEARPERKMDKEVLKKCHNDKRLYTIALKCQDLFPIEFDLADYVDWFPGFAEEILLCSEEEIEPMTTDETVKPKKYIERTYKIFNPINGTLIDGFEINPRYALEKEYYNREFHIRLKLLCNIVQHINKISKNLDVSMDDINKMCGFDKGQIEKYIDGTMPSLYNTYMIASAIGCQLDILAGPYRFIHFMPDPKKESDNG